MRDRGCACKNAKSLRQTLTPACWRELRIQESEDGLLLCLWWYCKKLHSADRSQSDIRGKTGFDGIGVGAWRILCLHNAYSSSLEAHPLRPMGVGRVQCETVCLNSPFLRLKLENICMHWGQRHSGSNAVKYRNVAELMVCLVVWSPVLFWFQVPWSLTK